MEDVRSFMQKLGYDQKKLKAIENDKPLISLSDEFSCIDEYADKKFMNYLVEVLFE